MPASSAPIPVGDARALGVVAGHDRVDRGAQHVAAGAFVDAEQRAQRLGERREGGAARCVAARREHGGALADAARELGDEARLAEAGRAEQDARGARRGRPQPRRRSR